MRPDVAPRSATRRRRRHRSAVAILTVSVGLLAAACSSSSDGGADTTSATVPAPTTTTSKPTTTTDSTDTTDATSNSTDDTTDDATAASDETSTTVAAVPVYPLTGTPVLDPVAATRPAMVVKIDNHPVARPQTGLNEADIVYEENVENLTRFAAVFQSNGIDPVGPIRSGRTQDVDLLGSLNKPLFIWSGGNGPVTAAITASDLVPVNETKAGDAMFRDRNRRGPHNLYGNMSALYTFAPPDAAAPPPQFEYRPDGAEPTGEPADGVKVSMDGIKVQWQWDETSGRYIRFSDDAVHIDAATDDPVSTHNVVVLFVEYRPSPKTPGSPEAQTEGYGVAWVFSGGAWTEGAWIRADRLDPFTLIDPDGEPMLLTPGRTFVELSRGGKGAVIPAGTDSKTVPYP